MRAMAVSAARAAARQEAAKRNAAAAAAAQQAQVQGQQRLQLRETVTWLQSLGRLPSSALLSRCGSDMQTNFHAVLLSQLAVAPRAQCYCSCKLQWSGRDVMEALL